MIDRGDWIFRDTGVALFVSFRMEYLQVREENQFLKMLVRVMEELDELTPRQAAWLEQLRGEPSENVNFGGLSQLEVRGQCELIRDAAYHRLPQHLYGVVCARFGLSGRKAYGIENVASALRWSAPIRDVRVLRDLVVRHYLETSERDGFSLRAIGKRYGIPKSTLGDGALWLAAKTRSLELEAIRRLDVLFVPHGVSAEWERAEA
ncbi:hypothetical protein [Cupriavidus sp. AcVe19-6a]|uniref:hypothetical protein n=1 Tax=Cupriavidus sp. AcVe19-6a TaxID=2821358 RepID=UPI001AE2EFB2|nr:hypothetical protein [Cupriavidus sp. AcVe19-6a]MBP0634888.1 hypothetical protein [Cupriavidus sp. AcVe19-6a]